MTERSGREFKNRFTGILISGRERMIDLTGSDKWRLDHKRRLNLCVAFFKIDVLVREISRSCFSKPTVYSGRKEQAGPNAGQI